MQVVWYWWGFRVYIDDPTLRQLIRATEQGESAVRDVLRQFGLDWLQPLVSALANIGVSTLRVMEASCGYRIAFTVPWSGWGAYISCA